MGTQGRPQLFCEERKIQVRAGIQFVAEHLLGDKVEIWTMSMRLPWVGLKGDSQELIAGKASLYFLICPDVSKLTHASSSQETLDQCAMN